jgi:hypothetical protein
MTRNAALLTVLTLLTGFLTTQTSARVAGATETFEDGSTRPVSIALLPAQAAVATQRLIKAESEVEESSEFSVIYMTRVAEVLESHGYLVKVISPETVNSDPQLQEYVLDANRRYDELLSQLRPRRVKRRLYNAGDEARALADYLEVDALGFPRLTIVGATGGKIAMSVLLGGGMGGSSGTLGLVDAHSGDIEAHLIGVGGNSARKFEEDPEGMIADIVERLVSGLDE